MGHTIRHLPVDGFEHLLTENEVEELIHLFYRWNDTTFSVSYRDELPNRRGLHTYLHQERKHVIVLSPGPIVRGARDGMRMGGNGPVPGRDPRLGAAMVLVHELQHANQAGRHLATERFYTHRDYNTRPCEREARAFVDTHLREVVALVSPGLLGELSRQAPVGADQATVGDVLGLFEGLREVSLAEVRAELRRAGLNTPVNVGRALRWLREAGVRTS